MTPALTVYDHICQDKHLGVGGMRSLYERLSMIPTSPNADAVLIRSHIAYHSGSVKAERATIAPSRGHSYRVNGDTIVRIVNYYDHRNGVTGWVQS